MGLDVVSIFALDGCTEFGLAVELVAGGVFELFGTGGGIALACLALVDPKKSFFFGFNALFATAAFMDAMSLRMLLVLSSSIVAVGVEVEST